MNSSGAEAHLDAWDVRYGYLHVTTELLRAIAEGKRRTDVAETTLQLINSYDLDGDPEKHPDPDVSTWPASVEPKAAKVLREDGYIFAYSNLRSAPLKPPTGTPAKVLIHPDGSMSVRATAIVGGRLRTYETAEIKPSRLTHGRPRPFAKMLLVEVPPAWPEWRESHLDRWDVRYAYLHLSQELSTAIRSLTHGRRRKDAKRILSTSALEFIDSYALDGDPENHPDPDVSTWPATVDPKAAQALRDNGYVVPHANLRGAPTKLVEGPTKVVVHPDGKVSLRAHVTVGAKHRVYETAELTADVLGAAGLLDRSVRAENPARPTAAPMTVQDFVARLQALIPSDRRGSVEFDGMGNRPNEGPPSSSTSTTSTRASGARPISRTTGCSFTWRGFRPRCCWDMATSCPSRTSRRRVRAAPGCRCRIASASSSASQ